MNKRLVNVVINVISPLTLGGFIYILFRSKTLLMFNWFDVIGFTYHIQTLRDIVNSVNYYLPQWIYFSLPDGLWTYAFTSAILLFDENKYFLLIPFSLSIVIELLQFFNLFKGTYDPIDLIFYFLGYVLPFFVFKNYKNIPVTLNQ
tara:strand:+ start:5790 stop:6227 length:438 start_codon:yes stop_codon:yes gene_type:complete